MISARDIGVPFPQLLVAAVFCGTPSLLHPQGVRTDSAGVEIVNVPTADRGLDWTFERIMSVGGAEDALFAFPDLDARYVAANDEGSVFVLD